MHHGMYRVCRAEIVAPFTLRVGFDDGTVQVIDFRPVLAGRLFGPLSEESSVDIRLLEYERCLT